MLTDKLKAEFSTAEAITQEFIALMNSSFARYASIRNNFFQQFPGHLHQSELVSLVNVELKKMVFDRPLCESVQDALKTLRRAIIRIEDAMSEMGGHVATDLTPLLKVAEAVEGLYQQHWEYYRYQSRLTEEDMVRFVFRIDRVAYEWDLYLERFRSAGAVVRNLSGGQIPQGLASVQLNYSQVSPEGQHTLPYSVTMLSGLLGFLDTAYEFVASLHGMSPKTDPMQVLEVGVGQPVHLRLGVPEVTREAFSRCLQYLFLDDLLKKETLYKFVYDAVQREYGTGTPLTAQALTTKVKALTTAKKGVPENGRFEVEGRVFPEEGVSVLQEFTRFLEQKSIKVDPLLKAMEQGKDRMRQAPMAPEASAPNAAGASQAKAPEAKPAQPQPQATDKKEAAVGKAHLQLLTERDK